MSPHDIIPIPWQPGMYARRALVDRLEAAGRPPINSAGRLKQEQRDAWNKYLNGTGSPADNPDRPDIYPLAHVRFVAADIDPTPERVAALTAAGLRRPYKYEPWHWELPNVYAYELVDSIPASAGLNPTPMPSTESEYDIMFIANVRNGSFWLCEPGKRAHLLGRNSGARESGIPIVNYPDDWAVKQLQRSRPEIS